MQSKGACAGPALHLIQRGRGRAACFSSAEDRAAYLAMLHDLAARAECAIHAYVLMANHVHLLLSAEGTESAVTLSQALCDRYQRYAAEACGREDRVWEAGREIRPVHARRYLLACMRYIELNPLRAHLVRRPEDYRWSSFRANALGEEDLLVAPHPLYYALGRTPQARSARYASFVRRGWQPGAPGA